MQLLAAFVADPTPVEARHRHELDRGRRDEELVGAVDVGARDLRAVDARCRDDGQRREQREAVSERGEANDRLERANLSFATALVATLPTFSFDDAGIKLAGLEGLTASETDAKVTIPAAPAA